MDDFGNGNIDDFYSKMKSLAKIDIMKYHKKIYIIFATSSLILLFIISGKKNFAFELCKESKM